MSAEGASDSQPSNKEISDGDVVQSNGDSTDITNPSPTKKAKLDESGDGSKPVKRRSSGRRSIAESDLFAEAKALVGDIDASSGRSLRKRPDPPKSEEKKKPGRRPSKKGKSEEKKETNEESKEVADAVDSAANEAGSSNAKESNDSTAEAKPAEDGEKSADNASSGDIDKNTEGGGKVVNETEEKAKADAVQRNDENTANTSVANNETNAEEGSKMDCETTETKAESQISENQNETKVSTDDAMACPSNAVNGDVNATDASQQKMAALTTPQPAEEVKCAENGSME